MLTRWYDIDRQVAAIDELARQMDRLFGAGPGLAPRLEVPAVLEMGWPRANLYDDGQSLVAVLLVPGLAEKDLAVEVHGDALTVRGERKAAPPEGYRIHRKERGARAFSRSFGLPTRVDSDRVAASLKDGVLTVTMPKHPESMPKQISVTAS